MLTMICLFLLLNLGYQNSLLILGCFCLATCFFWCCAVIGTPPDLVFSERWNVFSRNSLWKLRLTMEVTEFLLLATTLYRLYTDIQSPYRTIVFLAAPNCSLVYTHIKYGDETTQCIHCPFISAGYRSTYILVLLIYTIWNEEMMMAATRIMGRSQTIPQVVGFFLEASQVLLIMTPSITSAYMQ